MQPFTVLLAEDDADDREVFTLFLKDRDDLVVLPMVGNGEELLITLSLLPETEPLPDFILLDQNMPKLNGLQTLKILKQHQRFASIPVMVYSTYVDPILEKAVREFGAAKIARKPITIAGYHSMIDSFVEVLKNY